MGGGVRAGITLVEPVLIGQDDQKVGVQQVGDQCAQGIVVAEANFVGGDGIVLVDDRDDTQTQQGQERASGIQIAFTIRQVVVGQENLRGLDRMLLEQGLIGAHQPHLAHGGGRLELMQRMGAGAPAQPGHAFGNRTRGYQQDFRALPAGAGNLFDPASDAGYIQATTAARQQSAADLDYDASRSSKFTPLLHP